MQEQASEGEPLPSKAVSAAASLMATGSVAPATPTKPQGRAAGPTAAPTAGPREHRERAVGPRLRGALPADTTHAYYSALAAAMLAGGLQCLLAPRWVRTLADL